MFNTKMINEKEYVEIDFYPGCNIDDAMQLLTAARESGEDAYGEFNTHILTSDMTIDEAYLLILGKTKEEYAAEQQAWLEEYRREKEEYEAKIPELIEKWKAEGRKILAEDKIELWDEIVPIRLNDLYRGLDLEASLELISLLNQGEDLDVVDHALEAQDHSGCSYSLVCSTVSELANRGKEFYDYITKKNEEICG